MVASDLICCFLGVEVGPCVLCQVRGETVEYE